MRGAAPWPLVSLWFMGSPGFHAGDEAVTNALKAYAAKTWGTGRLVIAVAGRHTWVITPREDLDLGEVDPAANLKVVEGADGRISVTLGETR